MLRGNNSMPSSGIFSEVTSTRPWSRMYNRLPCGSTSQTCGTPQALYSSSEMADFAPVSFGVSHAAEPVKLDFMPELSSPKEQPNRAATAVTISPSRVRYIKLGEGGRWEKDCVDRGVLRIGFGTAESEQFKLCQARRWDEVSASFVTNGKTKGTATKFTNELRTFFDDNGSILWVTFVGERLYWGMVDQSPPKQDLNLHGVYRTIRDGWRCADVNGGLLTKDRLSGALTKLAAYQGTSCDVDVSEYVIRRINGKKPPEVERAIVASNEVKASALGLMKLLGPRDFELLVDLVFTTSGWRRVGIVGKTQKTLDLDLVLPSTGQRAFVQVKAKTTSAELLEYVAKIEDHYDRMFYVFHSGEAVTDDERVTVVGPEQLAELVMDAGLVSWLIQKVS